MADEYGDFSDEHMLGSARMIEAAKRGYRLDPLGCLPDGSFPPAVVEADLRPYSCYLTIIFKQSTERHLRELS